MPPKAKAAPLALRAAGNVNRTMNRLTSSTLFVSLSVFAIIGMQTGPLIDTARKLLAEGKITQLHEEKDVLHRCAAIWDECPEIWTPVSRLV